MFSELCINVVLMLKFYTLSYCVTIVKYRAENEAFMVPQKCSTAPDQWLMGERYQDFLKIRLED